MISIKIRADGPQDLLKQLNDWAGLLERAENFDSSQPTLFPTKEEVTKLLVGLQKTQGVAALRDALGGLESVIAATPDQLVAIKARAELAMRGVHGDA